MKSQAAINNVMPQNTQQLPSELNRDVEMIEEIKHVAPRLASTETASLPLSRNSCSADKVEILPGTSNSRNIGKMLAGSSRLKDQLRILTFRVHYQTNAYHIDIPDTSTVGQLIFIVVLNHYIYYPCSNHVLKFN